MPKRKSVAVRETASEPPRRRSLRNIQPPTNDDAAEPATSVPSRPKVKTADTPKPEKKTVAKKGTRKTPQKAKEEEPEKSASPEPQLESEPESEPEAESEPPAKKSRASKQQPKAKAAPKPAAVKATSKAAAAKKPASKTSKSTTIGASSTATTAGSDDDNSEKTYWLLKAEPETRMENGVDVKFSIDDLAAKKVPEPWDGIRAYPARNNLRAMKEGDLAFFYASNCKEPGIVGTMEIVQEHSPDLSAHDPKAPYYDASSKPSDPKWSVVHVEFRSKFEVPIGLKELRAMGAPGKPLENMQMLKQSRLSVSKVSAAEWKYLMGVAEGKVTAKKK